jgi:uncharacterized protein (TIGR00156 family)
MKYLILLLMFFMFSQESQAQFTGPTTSSDRQLTVAEVMQNARMLQLRGTVVQLRGFVAEHIRENYYLFKDSSGEIWIEIYRDVMPTWQFDDTTKVLLTGEVDFDFFRGTYIWVERIQKADELSQ